MLFSVDPHSRMLAIATVAEELLLVRVCIVQLYVKIAEGVRLLPPFGFGASYIRILPWAEAWNYAMSRINSWIPVRR